MLTCSYSPLLFMLSIFVPTCHGDDGIAQLLQIFCFQAAPLD